MLLNYLAPFKPKKPFKLKSNTLYQKMDPQFREQLKLAKMDCSLENQSILNVFKVALSRHYVLFVSLPVVFHPP